MRAAALRFAALVTLLFPSLALADPDPVPAGSATVTGLIDGASLQLDEGKKLRLVDITVPSRGAWADKEKAALAALVAGAAVTWRFAGTQEDRQGRILAQLYVGETWVQGELLRRGLARVAGSADERQGLLAMLAVEREARRYHRGLWADGAYAVASAGDAGKFAGSFALVSGTIGDVGSGGGNLFLSLGADWRTSPALVFDADTVKSMRAAGFDPRSLKGKPVLVRGFVDGAAHPRIAVTYPEQIEMLRQKKTAPKAASGP